MNTRGDAVFLGIGFGRILRREGQLNLRLRVAAAGPTHEGIGLARLALFKLEHPKIGFGFARLHRAFRGLVDDG